MKEIALDYIAPYRFSELLDFFKTRALVGVELIDKTSYARTVRIKPAGSDSKEELSGWLRVTDDPKNNQLILSLSNSLIAADFQADPQTGSQADSQVGPQASTQASSQIATRVRQMFDLDCDPEKVNKALSPLEKVRPKSTVKGTRLPGCFAPFETCCRAVLGQQISVAAANKLAERIAQTLGTKIKTDIEGLNLSWPTPEKFLEIDDITSVLGPLGVIKSRANAIVEIARMLKSGKLDFSAHADAKEQMAALQSIKGIGPWTANYVAMRVLSYSDAFLETDAGVAHALPDLTPKERLLAVETCRPWRSYAVVSLWNSLGEHLSANADKKTTAKNSSSKAAAKKANSKAKSKETDKKQASKKGSSKMSKASNTGAKTTQSKTSPTKTSKTPKTEETPVYYTEYNSKLIGPLRIASDGKSIIGCWFENDRYFGYGVKNPMEQRDDLPIFDTVHKWFDDYFAGKAPNPRDLPLAAYATPFQLKVREAMLDIAYGQTSTYGKIAKRLEKETQKRQSAQAVGGAVGHNPLCVIVPCHRVVGADGSLTGFGGGIDMKIKLLKHEGADMSKLYVPKHGTALDPSTWLNK